VSFDVDALIFGRRTCPACGVAKPANSEHFHRDRSRPDGLTLECSDCRNGRSVGRDNTERARRQRERYATDPEYRERKRAASRATGRKAKERARAGAQGGDGA
jgi:hypothetical protein